MTDRSDRWSRMIGPALAAVLPLLLLALGPSSTGVGAVAAVITGVVASVLLRGAGLPQLRVLEGVPFVAALVLVTVWAHPSPTSEIESGVAGLGVLLWVGQDLSWRIPLARAARGLALPALGLALSIGIALGFPAVQQSVGIAAILAVVCLVGLGWALGRPGDLAEASPS